MSDRGASGSPTILLVGATGLVGQAVLAASPVPVHALARRAPAPGDAPARHCVWHTAPASDWAARIADIRPDVLLCALGTTIAAAVSRDAFRAVDHDLVLACARAAKGAGTRHMIAVSSIGASAASRNFYLRTKGEVEAALGKLRFDRLDLMQPGLLVGARRGPHRAGESLGMALAPITDRMLWGSLRRYRSVPAAQVAAAMLALALMQGQRGRGGITHRHEHDALIGLAGQLAS